jgi:uncharacterized protein YkwD
MKTLIKAGLLAFFLLSLLTSFAVFAHGNGGSASQMQEDILYYTNKFRKKQGLPPLQMSESLNRIATNHSRNMASGRTGFGHSGFESRVNQAQNSLGSLRAYAENVAYGQMDAEEVVDGWIRSRGHRKNMLGNYNLIGIGVGRARNGQLYFTQFFVQKQGAR